MKKLSRNVLVKPKARKLLEQHRDQVRKNGKTVHVRAHERKVARIESVFFRREARRVEAEDAIFRLCADRQRRGPVTGDKDFATQLKEFLNDVFGV